MFIDPDKSDSLPLSLRRFESEFMKRLTAIQRENCSNGYGQSLDPFDENSVAMSTAASSTVIITA